MWLAILVDGEINVTDLPIEKRLSAHWFWSRVLPAELWARIKTLKEAGKQEEDMAAALRVKLAEVDHLVVQQAKALRDAETENTTLRRNLAKTTQELTRAMGSLDVAKDQDDFQKENMILLQKELDEAQGQVWTLQEEVDTMESERAEMDAAMLQLQQQVVDLRGRLRAKTLIREGTDFRYLGLEAQLDGQTIRVALTQSELTRASGRFGDLVEVE